MCRASGVPVNRTDGIAWKEEAAVLAGGSGVEKTGQRFIGGGQGLANVVGEETPAIKSQDELGQR